jgi:DNA-binding NarL/FixJ family response regulator
VRLFPVFLSTGIKTRDPKVKIVEATSRPLFTMHESEHLAAEVSQAGAQGFVLKAQAGKDLIRAIERLLGGGTFFGSESNPQENVPGLRPSGTLAGPSSEAGVGFLRALVALPV